MTKEFGYRGEEETCLWCGEELVKTLRHWHYDEHDQFVPKTGELVAGFDNYFCNLLCGYEFALAMALRGKKFNPR